MTGYSIRILVTQPEGKKSLFIFVCENSCLAIRFRDQSMTNHLDTRTHHTHALRRHRQQAAGMGRPKHKPQKKVYDLGGNKCEKK